MLKQMEHPLVCHLRHNEALRWDSDTMRWGPGVETRQGARRPCDVFVKRCRVGTKETRFSGCPRGSITGGGGGGSGREVTDKRESYKMGCVTRESGEKGGGEGVQRTRGTVVPVGARGAPRRCGNPGDERANTILQLSRLRPDDEKSEIACDEGGRGTAGSLETEIEEPKARGSRSDLSNFISRF